MGFKLTTDGTFVEAKATKNAQYIQVRFIIPEIYKGTEIDPTFPNLNVTIKGVDLPQYSLLPGHTYALTLNVDIQQATEAYAARLNFSLLNAVSSPSYATA